MVFELGKRIEGILIEYLRGSGYRIEDTQGAFEDFNGLFRGHCDGVNKRVFQGEPIHTPTPTRFNRHLVEFHDRRYPQDA